MLYALENLHREAVSASQRKPLNYKLKFHLKSADVQAFCVWVWFGTWLHSGGGTCPLQGGFPPPRAPFRHGDVRWWLPSQPHTGSPSQCHHLFHFNRLRFGLLIFHSLSHFSPSQRQRSFRACLAVSPFLTLDLTSFLAKALEPHLPFKHLPFKHSFSCTQNSLLCFHFIKFKVMFYSLL